MIALEVGASKDNLFSIEPKEEDDFVESEDVAESAYESAAFSLVVEASNDWNKINPTIIASRVE